MGIVIKNLNKSFSNLIIFKDFNMEISKSMITCILGPSGSGKTTLLNMISGIVKPDSGIFQGLEGREISYLFQEPRLLEWKTVWNNLDFVLTEKFKKEEKEKIISKYLEMVELTDFKDYYPGNLSGGMKQRVAIARAFAYPSKILIMDEPFKGLDYKLKISLMDSFVKLWIEDRRTVIFVTHDVEEAVYLGDEIYVLSKPPAKIRIKHTNNIPINERKFKHKRSYEAERKIYEIMDNEE